MRKTVLLVVVMLMCAGAAMAAKKDGDRITAGDVKYRPGHYLAGESIRPGFDAFGYNYQAHMFRGSYYNSYAGGAGFPPWTGDDEAYLEANPAAANHWAWPHRKVQLLMKWNDAWLSNMDRDGDGLLDRHYGLPTYDGSGAWLTNHQSGDDEESGHWTYFVKINTPPADADKVDGVWYTADGTKIGPAIWGAFAVVLRTESGVGAYDLSPAGPGLGKFKPKK
jgi:hypothetical protein